MCLCIVYGCSCWAAATETFWPAKPTLFTNWSFIEKVCQQLGQALATSKPLTGRTEAQVLWMLHHPGPTLEDQVGQLCPYTSHSQWPQLGNHRTGKVCVRWCCIKIAAITWLAWFQFAVGFPASLLQMSAARCSCPLILFWTVCCPVW